MVNKQRGIERYELVFYGDVMFTYCMLRRKRFFADSETLAKEGGLQSYALSEIYQSFNEITLGSSNLYKCHRVYEYLDKDGVLNRPDADVVNEL